MSLTAPPSVPGSGDSSLQAANREKRLVALSSVVAAVFLTAMKVVVGLMTGSLGILSEAAHSALDLVAAAVTLFAVRFSERPADRDHTYGHGKVENLSALFETSLLLLTCLWIVVEAIERLFFKEVPVEASVWAFAAMGVSIAVDLSRSRALARTARKYSSQALEADALHFSTDVWSSLVVIGGLVLVKLSEHTGIAWLARADTVAALGVAGIVIWVSLRLARRTVGDLMDAAAPGTREQITRAVSVAGVLDVSRVRVRRVGPNVFADVVLKVAGGIALEEAHAIAGKAEEAVSAILPGADVMVHVEPSEIRGEGIAETVRRLALQHGIGAHAVRVHDVLGRRSVELHLEVDPAFSVVQAHDRATAFEAELRNALPEFEDVVTHIEPSSRAPVSRSASAEDEREVLKALSEVHQQFGITCEPHDLSMRRVGDELHVTFHWAVDAGAAIADAHALAERVEMALRERVPHLGCILIHVEPREE